MNNIKWKIIRLSKMLDAAAHSFSKEQAAKVASKVKSFVLVDNRRQAVQRKTRDASAARRGTTLLKRCVSANSRVPFSFKNPPKMIHYGIHMGWLPLEGSLKL